MSDAAKKPEPQVLTVAEIMLLPVWTVPQLAKVLQVPVSSTYEAISRQVIPGVEDVLKHKRVSRDRVLKWLADGGSVSRPRRARGRKT